MRLEQPELDAIGRALAGALAPLAPADAPLEGLLTRAEVAALLRVSVATVDRLRREGRLSAVALGGATRYRPGDLRRLIARSAVSPPAS